MDDRLWGILVESFPKILIPGLTITIPLTIISFAIGMVIAVLTALVQFANVKVLKQLARFYIWVIRGTPLLVQLFVVFYGLPSVGIVLDAFPSAVIVFSISVGAYCAETMRAAPEAVPKGQIEAGYCVGMNYFQIMWRIVLPQAFRTAFPPLSNSLISLVKDTSLAANITGNPAKRFSMVTKCCCTRIVVGASSAACFPPMTHLKIALSATSVLP